MAIALALDFLASEVLDARVTASGGANGTRVNSSGLIAGATCPRFDYDPTTRAPRGLLIEEARTNLLLYSEQLENAAWTKLRASVSANAGMSPDGTANADKLVEDIGANDNHYTLQTISLAAATYTRTIYLKAAGRNWARVSAGGLASCYYDLVNGATGTLLGTGSPSASISNAGNGWWRCALTFTAPAGSTPFYTLTATGNGGDVYTGDGSSGILIWGDQVEAGAFATSYIRTTSATVTRSADDLSMTGTNFSSWFNAAEGTFVIDAELPAATNADWLAVYDSSVSTTALLEVYKKSSTTMGYNVVASSAVQADIQTPALAIGSPHKVAFAYKQDDFALSANGGTVVTDASGSNPVGLASLAFGQYKATGLGYMSSRFRRLVYDNTRRSNADLQAISVGRGGSSAITEDGDAISAIGTVKIKAAAAITEGDDTTMAAGEVGRPAVVPSRRTLTL